MKAPVAVVAALVVARQRGGRLLSVGPHGKAAFDAHRLGLVERVGDQYELNLRGQDVADEAIRLGKAINR